MSVLTKLTNLAKHLEVISHDKINRYLKNEKLTPSLLWDNVKELIEREENTYLIFDDIIDKRYSEEIVGATPSGDLAGLSTKVVET